MVYLCNKYRNKELKILLPSQVYDLFDPTVTLEDKSHDWNMNTEC